MAKGFATARKAIEEINAKRNSGGGGGQFFKLEPGQSATVRFLDDEIEWMWAHELPRADNAKYSKLELCRDQDPETGGRIGGSEGACEGCEKDYKRKMHARIRVIQRDAPVYETVKDDQGNEKKNFEKVIGNADQVVIWTVGKMVIEELEGAASTFKGLTSRDFVVTREGTGGLDTSYDVKPVVDEEGNTSKTPMSEADEALAAESSPVVYRIPNYEEWGKGGSSKGGSAPAAVDSGPFKRRATATA